LVLGRFEVATSGAGTLNLNYGRANPSQCAYNPKERTMNSRILQILHRLHNDEAGQDLIEYALVAALIAFGAVSTMGSLATDLNSAFSVIGSSLNSAVA
jgi:pilus assembly protein Flp/PilA